MNIKSFLKENGMKVAEISRKSGIPYSTLNDIINGKTDIDGVKLGTVRELADCMGIGLDELYRMCKESTERISLAGGNIFVKNKRYYLSCGQEYSIKPIPLCKVNPVNTMYVKEMAEWTLAELKRARELAVWS